MPQGRGRCKPGAGVREMGREDGNSTSRDGPAGAAPAAGKGAQDERQRRRAEALRENLRRRKRQQRERGGGGEPAPDG